MLLFNVVNNMSLLKKHIPPTSHYSIALHDFTPSALLLQYEPSSAHVNPVAEKPRLTMDYLFSSADDRRNFKQWLSHYATTQKANKASEFSTEHSAVQNRKSADTAAAKPLLRPQEFWQLTQQDRVLVKGSLKISLTAIESAIIRKMLHHEERVVSKEELIRDIGREPERYRGLEMCLSRLQEKFKRANDGERLFRAVRNRGYCLTQKIKKLPESKQSRAI
jgi:two-component system OmpR family response regulator